MYHRISHHLKSLRESFHAHTQDQNELYLALQQAGLSAELMREKVEEVYQSFVASNPRITTIDAFFNAVLKKFCWYVGVSRGFEIGKIDELWLNEAFLQRLKPQELQALVHFCFSHKLKISQFMALLGELYKFGDNERLQLAKYSHLSLVDIEEGVHTRWAQIQSALLNAEKIHKSAPGQFSPKSIEGICGTKLLLDWREHSYFKNFDPSALDSLRDEILELIRLYFLKKEENIFKWLKLYVDVYAQAKHKWSVSENLLGFDDVMMKNYELLHKNIDRDFFYFRLDGKITHVLLDEFQDTSLMQYQILKPIMDEICAGNGRLSERSLFMVGDEKQSIYMFRGSFAGVFEEASKNLAQENLNFNYRSSERVIERNNAIFSSCYSNYTYQLYPHSKPTAHGYVRIFEPLEGRENVGKRVNEELDLLLERGVDEDDIAILVFKNDDALFLKEKIAMHNHKLNVVTESSASLFEKKESKILCYALKLLRIQALYAQNQDKALLGTMKLYEKNMIKLLGRVYEETLTLDGLKLDNKDSLGEIVLILIEHFRLSNVVSMKFLELACEFGGVDEFLDAIPTLMCNAPEQSNKGVKILTIHKSKGLEFKHVILVDYLGVTQSDKTQFLYRYDGVEIRQIYYRMKYRESFDRFYEQTYTKHKERLQQEAYNVLYVAFTRAKLGLSVIQKKSERNFKSAFEILCISSELDEIPIQERKQELTQENIQPCAVVPLMVHYGVQNDFLIQNDEFKYPTSLQQWRNIIFGQALHKAFELYLGYGMSREDLCCMLFNHFGFYIQEREYGASGQIEDVISKMLSCVHSDEFQALMYNKKIMCEVSYIHNERIYRMDMLLCDEKEWIVFDYKSSTFGLSAQEEQVRGYMNFLNLLRQTDNLESTQIYGYVQNDRCIDKQAWNRVRQTRGFIVYPLLKSNQLCEVNLENEQV